MTDPMPLFAPSVRAGSFVFVSGQVAVDDQGDLVCGAFEEEMRRSVENVQRVLKDAGLALSDVVKVSAYVQDPGDLPEYNRIYPEYFPHAPARTTLTSCLGDLVKFELDVIAYAGD